MNVQNHGIIKHIILIIFPALVVSGCLTLPEGATMMPPEPTPEGQWAGLAYGNTEWELITYEGNEETSIYFPEYRDGMEILVYPHPYTEGCQLTYWLGGQDGNLEEDWAFLGFNKVLGDNQFAVVARIYKGKLVQLTYLYEPKALGFFSLRLSPEIESCVYRAERLLSTLNPAGMELYMEIHHEREVRRQTTGMP